MPKSKAIQVDVLARVEGEGALDVKFAGGRVAELKLKIPEPPRLFEAFLHGRHFMEIPDIVARICGICPIAYQMSAVHAIEAALGVEVHPSVRALRRLFYCGEWIESHALHVYMLHAPDFLGYTDALALAKDHGETVKLGLALKKTGNDLVALLGGREIHPVSACPGGFYRVPSKAELRKLEPALRRAREIAVATVEFTRALPFPRFSQDYEFVALRHDGEYAMNEGRLVSNKGLDIAIRDYEDHFAEEHVAHANALHSRLRARGAYFVGPLARYNLNFDKLPAHIRKLAEESGIQPPVRNPFQGIVVRAIELVLACEEALRIIGEYEPPPAPRAIIAPKAGTGWGCTEAPRGILYHRYSLAADGRVTAARIVPPTSQNQRQIEEDLFQLLDRMAGESIPAMTARCEQAIRNYDPCISCATHFLKLNVMEE